MRCYLCWWWQGTGLLLPAGDTPGLFGPSTSAESIWHRSCVPPPAWVCDAVPLTAQKSCVSPKKTLKIWGVKEGNSKLVQAEKSGISEWREFGRKKKSWTETRSGFSLNLKSLACECLKDKWELSKEGWRSSRGLAWERTAETEKCSLQWDFLGHPLCRFYG